MRGERVAPKFDFGLPAQWGICYWNRRDLKEQTVEAGVVSLCLKKSWTSFPKAILRHWNGVGDDADGTCLVPR
jgi:hypothetical protein